MSITDELREWARDNTVWGEIIPTNPVQHHVHGTLESLLAIADRIDAEHESKVSYWQGTSYKDGYDEGLASADDYFTDKRETLEEHGWVKLPVDADGEPLRVGDELVLQHEVWEKPYVAESITWDGEDWYFTCDEGFFNAAGWSHHHPPTVEDVLTEFAQRNAEIPNDESGTEPFEALLAEYAAKLRLAGEGE